MSLISALAFSKTSGALRTECIETLPVFTVGNSITGLSQVVPQGVFSTVGYRLTSGLLEANEVQLANQTVVYKDTSDVVQSTFLDETNDKFLFPSNLYTFDATFVRYTIRFVLVVDYPALSNKVIKYYVRIRREVDDSIIFSREFIQTDFPAETGVIVSSIIETFVNSETDPFVVDGVYLDVLNDSNSNGDVTLQDVSIRIFRG